MATIVGISVRNKEEKREIEALLKKAISLLALRDMANYRQADVVKLALEEFTKKLEKEVIKKNQ